MESSAQDVSLVLPILLFLVIGTISLAMLAFWIWMLIDCVKYEPDEGNTKLVWVLVIIFTQLLGAIIYYFVQRRERLQKQTPSGP